ncbi:secretin N-terminal domain-containing protein [Salinicola salarius]|uniref:secretin N-terminal domain-containing protein n=1 Tax=Salinicola salarius TaxID=430457 RepID=UPI0023E39EB8|nr:secretin N-terminal domain-containing protein [Salinicola salarius]MDF3920039.1 secretin N-terminal domain-containing protein [Salinicola salarius]
MPTSVARHTLAALALAAAFSAPAAHAMPIDMQDADVRDFVHWYSQETQSPIAIDPGVTGTLTVYAPDVTPEQLPEFFQGVMQSHGYQLIPGNPPTLVSARPTDDFMGRIGMLEPQQPTVSRVLPITHLRADDLAPLVDAFLSRTTTGSLNAANAQVLHSTNALLVNAPADRVDDLERLLPQIDVTRAQVLIQAIIFETTDGDTFDLGVSFGRARNGSNPAGGFNTSSLGTALSTPGASFGIFDGDTLALAINAIRRDSNARVLSTPQILTLSGQRGTISVGQNVPFITGRITGEAANIENPFQTIERRDIGITLNVFPVVTPSGLVVMDVNTAADSLTDSLLASDIITNQRSIDTTVQIQSGQSVLLGGLVSEENRQQQDSVPILSDIPVIGALFRSTSTSNQTSNLYVLLQATVLPTQETAS